jgi:hypothetical protein
MIRFKFINQLFMILKHKKAPYFCVTKLVFDLLIALSTKIYSYLKKFIMALSAL